MKAVYVLLRHSIDYAGLFPPAALDMPSAVDNYAGYREGDDSWALGRFVLPAERLSEFARTSAQYGAASSAEERWPLAALAGPDLAADLAVVAAFNQESPRASVDTLELKADSAAVIGDLMRRIPEHLQTYVEIPVDRDPTPLLTALKAAGARAKVRTGGVTRNSFPDSSSLLRFVASCVQMGVAFKATAGLHHPLRAEYRLTYAPDSDRGPMFGFLNLFLAGAFLRAGMNEDQAHEALVENSPAAIGLEGDGISWRGRRLEVNQLKHAREEVMVSFGSCSFTEPLSELQALHPFRPGVRQA
jgi:hypothetical protein